MDPVVVGVDGSPSSLDAVEVAAREAGLRGVGLRLVHAFGWPSMHLPPGGPRGIRRWRGCGSWWTAR